MSSRGGVVAGPGGYGPGGDRCHLRRRRVLSPLRGPAADGSGVWGELGAIGDRCSPGAVAGARPPPHFKPWTLLVLVLLSGLLAAGRCGATPTSPPATPAPPTTPSPPSSESSEPAEPSPLPSGGEEDGDGPETSEDLRGAVRDAQVLAASADFFTCPPPTGSTVVRLEPPRACPKFNLGRNFTEGIAVIFKENIAPYKFRGTVYYKDVVVSKLWKGWSHTSITNRYTDRVPVSVEEIMNTIDAKGNCSSKAEYLRDNIIHHAYHKDADEEEMILRASKFTTPGSRAWHTTNRTNAYLGWVRMIHYTSTSVNCIVEEVDARSVYPYDSFALSTGDVVYISPFYGLRDGAHLEHTSYAPERFRQVEGYRARDLDTGKIADTPVTRNFVKTPHVTVGWDWHPKKPHACTLTKWREADEILRDEVGGSYRFTIRALSTTFLSNKTQFDLKKVPLSGCVTDEAEKAINDIYKRRYESTHVFSGPMETYLARGGFVIAFRPMLSNELARLYLNELVRSNRTYDPKSILQHSGNDVASSEGKRTRRSLLSVAEAVPAAQPSGGHELHRLRRRAADAATQAGKDGKDAQLELIKTTSSVEFAMLQFAYDHIQAHVNEMLSRIATAWCTLQNKERVLWNEMVKINPSAIASSSLNERVAARVLGDVIAITQCVKIEGEVFLQNSMRTGDGHSCYSRPPVTFTIVKNATGGTIEGQLGEDNELLIERKLVEPCALNHKRYFKFGSDYVYYENYTYVRNVPLTEIEMISTYVDLNLTLLEDREFLPLEVYTRAELEDTGLMDYSEIQRRNQLHALKFYDIDSVITVDTDTVIMQGLANFFQGLGKAGQAIGKLVIGAAGAVVSTVSSIISFVKNPFGALAVGLLVLAGLVAAFFAYRYVMQLRANPMKALYPITTQGLKNSAKAAMMGGGDGPEFDEDKLEQAREMIRYMSMVSAMEKQEKKALKKNSGPALIANHVSNLALRKRGPKYTAVPSEDEAESYTVV
ncbi:envelope glycoprotein B [Equid alphaherpesvirus 3]|uniref:Envelope glycoprotein B n=1 Tax=Equid alphaherpesvirus 3 TaxID=80341 RepID=A0A077B5Z7_9ALPH|nr:envelope glycoprotein B [Equid alphaherpesvirus 3]AIL02950.1 envelope glycoprotein B [Equid alphaherpesvirus 3]BAX04353.1 envelope glycoprotein B [Equid alphaherpesvirus 3]